MGNSVGLSALQWVGVTLLLSGVGIGIYGFQLVFSVFGHGDDGLGGGLAAGLKMMQGTGLLLLGIVLFGVGIALLFIGRH